MEEQISQSRWGPGDEIGALNLITASQILGAANLVRKGKVYNLSHILEMGIPSPSFHGPLLYSTYRRTHDPGPLAGGKNDPRGMNLRIETADHMGTHIDGLNHMAIGDTLYNGISSSEIIGTHGTTKLGIEKVEGIVGRGILVDIAKMKGIPMLDDQHVITRDEIEKSLASNHLQLSRGDIVLLRTGWTNLWMVDNDRYLRSCPGIGKEASEWLVRKEVSIVGADCWNVEVAPAEDPEEICPCHQILITRNGVRLIENLVLDDLSRDQLKEFLFVCTPLRIKGGCGSPVSPLAIA